MLIRSDFRAGQGFEHREDLQPGIGKFIKVPFPALPLLAFIPGPLITALALFLRIWQSTGVTKLENLFAARMLPGHSLDFYQHIQAQK